mmetsp:Transcript_90162/g.255304  ORF Transcript_90162/g.255304 Transcript_90162/m.255304 type:complete len:253 (+) Transcript_90162:259-1017(+)
MHAKCTSYTACSRNHAAIRLRWIMWPDQGMERKRILLFFSGMPSGRSQSGGGGASVSCGWRAGGGSPPASSGTGRRTPSPARDAAPSSVRTWVRSSTSFSKSSPEISGISRILCCSRHVSTLITPANSFARVECFTSTVTAGAPPSSAPLREQAPPASSTRSASVPAGPWTRRSTTASPRSWGSGAADRSSRVALRRSEASSGQARWATWPLRSSASSLLSRIFALAGATMSWPFTLRLTQPASGPLPCRSR